MLRTQAARWLRTAAVVSSLAALSACAPIPKVVDTPKDGDNIKLALEQPMQVRWANLNPQQGSWVLARAPGGAVTSKGRTVQPPANGAQQLEVFDFTGARKGADTMTFVYRHNDGQPSTADEQITLNLTVG